MIAKRLTMWQHNVLPCDSTTVWQHNVLPCESTTSYRVIEQRLTVWEHNVLPCESTTSYRVIALLCDSTTSYRVTAQRLTMWQHNVLPCDSTTSYRVTLKEENIQYVAPITRVYFRLQRSTFSFDRLLITFANNLDPDQNQQHVGPGLDPNDSTLW